MSRNVDPETVVVKFEAAEEGGRVEIEETYPGDVEGVERVADLYDALMGDEAQTTVKQADDGRPVVTATSASPAGRKVAAAAAVGLVERAGSKSELAEMAARLSENDERGVY